MRESHVQDIHRMCQQFRWNFRASIFCSKLRLRVFALNELVLFFKQRRGEPLRVERLQIVWLLPEAIIRNGPQSSDPSPTSNPHRTTPLTLPAFMPQQTNRKP